MNDSAAPAETITRVEGTIGRITLNRPNALNALTLGMVRAIDRALIGWADDPAVRIVLIEAAERGFCAGGDIRSIYEAARAGDAMPATFWREEYLLDARIKRYAKPIVPVMDGIVMGGGVGISAHASHRIVTERSTVAMPEVGIGLFPDVGGTYLLARAPGELGTHLALTASRMGAADALLCGFADRHIPSDRLGGLAAALQGLAAAEEVMARLSDFATDPAPGALAAARPWIDVCYGGDSVEAIRARLLDRPEPEARAAAAEMAAKSPTSLKLALRLLREARRLGRLEPCLNLEFRAALACIRGHDFMEGIRAAVIDKDRNPRWSPARLEEVGPAIIESHIAPIGAEELGLA